MDFKFVCPHTQQLFDTEKFDIIDNRGVITDVSGQKILDAKVILTEPCPHCGQRHIYHANDMLCPFTGSDKDTGDDTND